MATLVTGAAGFIGFHLCRRLLSGGEEVLGLDNLNPYYDPRLKESRLEILQGQPGFRFFRMDLQDRDGVKQFFDEHRPPRVVNLAAQAGVRYSLQDPHAYVDSNLQGFLNILEGCRHTGVRHLVFASSSSVYGAAKKIPFAVGDPVDHPISLYAATKKANELMAHSYSHLFGIPTTGLRFFTVYGPWGRPDMAYFSFTKAIAEGRPIQVFNRGEMRRDFTFVDDIVEGVVRVLAKPPSPISEGPGEDSCAGSTTAPYRLYNIGNNAPVPLMRLIEIIEDYLGKKAEKVYLPMQPGDVPETYADISDLVRAVGFSPATPIEEGMRRFLDWYTEYCRLGERPSSNP